MASHPRTPRPRGDRRGRRLRPCLLQLEQRVVPPDVSRDRRHHVRHVRRRLRQLRQHHRILGPAAVRRRGRVQRLTCVNASVFGTTGASAFPGTLTTVGSSASLPSIAAPSDILELQPNGQLFVFNPVGGTSSQYDNLADDTANASNVFDVQTGASVNLSGQISLAGATYGDFGVYQNSLVVSAESNNWDFVMRVTYGSSGGVATVLVASPASDGLSASPGGVAVDSQGTVLTTMPYVPAGSTTAIHVPVGFSLSYDTGSSPAPFVPTLGLTSVPDIDSGGITVDSQNNFILAVTNSSLYGGGPGIVHINSALTAFLADPVANTERDSDRDRLPGRGGNELSRVHRRGLGYVYDRRRAAALQRPGQPRAAPARLRHRPDQLHGPRGHHRRRRRLRPDDRHRRGGGRPHARCRPDDLRPVLRHSGSPQLPGRGPERGHHAEPRASSARPRSTSSGRTRSPPVRRSSSTTRPTSPTTRPPPSRT